MADIVNVATAVALVEDYPDHAKGPCVLVLQHDEAGEPSMWSGAFREGTPLTA